jgi:hypothetical protein
VLFFHAMHASLYAVLGVGSCEGMNCGEIQGENFLKIG